MKIAIQGEAGSFSHQAAMRMVPRCVIVPCARSVEVFDRLQQGSVAAAVIPVENSLAGSVAEHLDLLLARQVFVTQEFRLRIAHNLIAARNARMKDIRRVYSHPVALDQCRDFFQCNPQVQAVPFYDTAGSVKHVIESKLPDAAAIAGRQAALVYKGRILASGLEDDKRNFTRFFQLRKKRHLVRGANKTSIAFITRNVPGALFQALGVFASRGIDLSKIESRPLRGKPWEYVFYADFLRGDDEVARGALRSLRKLADLVKVLGIYRTV
ncbi:MAG: prephenate dehydratase [Terriglobales bacterium]